jgi:hypothetical protein
MTAVKSGSRFIFSNELQKKLLSLDVAHFAEAGRSASRRPARQLSLDAERVRF